MRRQLKPVSKRIPSPAEFKAAYDKALPIPPQQAEDEINPLTDDELFISTPAPDPAKFALLWDMMGKQYAIENYSHLEHCAFVYRLVKLTEVKSWPEAARLAINRHMERNQ